MKAVRRVRVSPIARPVLTRCLFFASVTILSFSSPSAGAEERAKPSTVQVTLSEWNVAVTPSEIPPGPVVLEITNTGKIPHALEIEGRGVEKSTSRLKPGDHATLAVDLRAGTYEAYCPVGKGSHKMLGMTTHLMVGDARPTSAKRLVVPKPEKDRDEDEEYTRGVGKGDGVKVVRVVGGGPVIQILPGAFPFADSAMAVIQSRPEDQKTDLIKKTHLGPYSNNVAKISGTIAITAIDRGATGDSVSGTAEFTARDGARWKVVMDRVQTKDIPMNPRFGGVIMGLFYHGSSGVHTPLVPTIQSSLALWAYAHVYRNDALVTDNAMVHVMLLSRTRRVRDWALDCWDCSDRPVEELQLQVTTAPNAPSLAAPGGFLFVNWEKSSGRKEAL